MQLARPAAGCSAHSSPSVPADNAAQAGICFTASSPLPAQQACGVRTHVSPGRCHHDLAQHVCGRGGAYSEHSTACSAVLVAHVQHQHTTAQCQQRSSIRYAGTSCRRADSLLIPATGLHECIPSKRRAEARSSAQSTLAQLAARELQVEQTTTVLMSTLPPNTDFSKQHACLDIGRPASVACLHKSACVLSCVG